MPQFFQMQDLGAITPELVERYLNRLSREGYAPGTVRGTYGVLRNALNTAVRLRMIAVNPWRESSPVMAVLKELAMRPPVVKEKEGVSEERQLMPNSALSCGTNCQ